jgi:CRISPR system Cascade subunit CasE
MSPPTLYLLHTRPDARLLATWMARHHARHERQTADLGDALHGLLRAAFGEAAPQPFRYLDERQGLLAYTPLDAAAMRAQVALADPLVAQTLGLGASSEHDGYRLRPFPTAWPKGKMLGFEVRVRPIVRTANGERDAFLHALDQARGAGVQREAVYMQWLRDHLAGHGGAAREAWQGAVDLINVELAAYQRLDVVRRTQALADEPRRGRISSGPDAVLKGRLCVKDPEAFAHLLVRGVGRHRAFGFGMVLLNRAS